MLKNLKKAEQDLLKLIFAISVLIVFVTSTLFVALTAQYVVVEKNGNQANAEAGSARLELQKKSAPNGINANRRKLNITNIINRNSSRFQQLDGELTNLMQAYITYKETGSTEEAINQLINEACANAGINNSQNCSAILRIVIQNLEEQYKKPAEEKLSPKDFMIDLLSDLVNAGLISESLLNDIAKLTADVKALVEAIKNYNENPQAIVDAVKTLASDLNYLLTTYTEAESFFEIACAQSEMPEACEILLQAAIIALQQYQENGDIDEEALLAMIRGDFEQLGLTKIAEVNEQFITLNQAMISMLEVQRDILFNLVDENIGSRTLDADAQELKNKLASYQNVYSVFYEALEKRITEDEKNDENFTQMLVDMAKYIKDIVQSYPKYTAHSAITAHYLRNGLAYKSLKNQVLYANDMDSVIYVLENYTELDGSTLHNMLAGETGLVPMINSIEAPLNQIKDNWFQLFLETDMEKITSGIKTLQKEQNDINTDLVAIKKQEGEILIQVCKTLNADDVSACTYVFGTVLKAIASGESPQDAVCSQASDPEKCARNWESLKNALAATRESDEASGKLFLENLMKELVGEEAWAEIAILIAEATSDEEVRPSELVDILAALVSALYEAGYLQDQAENAFSKLCKNTDNPEECVEMMKTYFQLARQVYQGDKTAEQAMAEIFADIVDDLENGDPEETLENMNNILETIKQTLMVNETTTHLLINRGMSDYANNLREDHDVVQGYFNDLQALTNEIADLLAQLADAENERDIARISAELSAATTEYFIVLVRLNEYYVSNYEPNLFAGGYLVINHNYDKRLRRSSLNSKHAWSMYREAAEMYPEENWTDIQNQLQAIDQAISNDITLYGTANPKLIEITQANNPRQTMRQNNAVEAQKQLNEGIYELTKEKKKLAEELQQMVLAIGGAEQQEPPQQQPWQ